MPLLFLQQARPLHILQGLSCSQFCSAHALSLLNRRVCKKCWCWLRFFFEIVEAQWSRNTFSFPRSPNHKDSDQVYHMGFRKRVAMRFVLYTATAITFQPTNTACTLSQSFFGKASPSLSLPISSDPSQLCSHPRSLCKRPMPQAQT